MKSKKQVCKAQCKKSKPAAKQVAKARVFTFSSKEETLIKEVQKLKSKVRVLQKNLLLKNKELAAYAKANDNGLKIIDKLQQQVDALQAPEPAVFTPPQLADDAGPTVPATLQAVAQ